MQITAKIIPQTQAAYGCWVQSPCVHSWAVAQVVDWPLSVTYSTAAAVGMWLVAPYKCSTFTFTLLSQLFRYKLAILFRHETVLVNTRNKPDWLFEVNPRGKVPVLEYKGKIVYESAVCDEFLEDTFPSSVTGTRPLLPSSPSDRAAGQQLMLKFDQVCWRIASSSATVRVDSV